MVVVSDPAIGARQDVSWVLNEADAMTLLKPVTLPTYT